MNFYFLGERQPMRHAPVLVLFALFPLLLHAQRYSPAQREILILQDQRSLGNGTLLSYLIDKDWTHRMLAARALGNIQDTTVLDALVPLLSDRSTSVRATAAWALGQSGSARAQSALLRRLPGEGDGSVARRIVEALGKCGNDSALAALMDLAESKVLKRTRGETCLSVGRFALRGIRSDEAVRYCFKKLGDEDAGVRWRALYALWRSAPYPSIDGHIARSSKLLRSLSTDRSADVRMHLATLLGRSQAKEALEVLRWFANRELRKGEWRVQVQIVRSLGTWVSREPGVITLINSYLREPNNHVRIAALQSLRILSSDQVGVRFRSELRQTLLSLANPTKRLETAVRGNAIQTVAKLFPTDFIFTELLDAPHLPVRLKADIVEGLGLIPQAGNLRFLLDLTTADSVMIARTAWEAIPVLLRSRSLVELQRADTNAQDVPSILYRRIKASLLRDDMAITTAVAQAVEDSVVFSLLESGGYAEETIEELMLAYTRLSSPNDVEAMHAILDALGKHGGTRSLPVLERALQDSDRTVALRAAMALRRITGREIVLPLRNAKPLHTDYDWKTLERLKEHPRVRVQTDKGSFVIELLPQHAPFSVVSFVALVRKGFYNGLTFHRVVPNFVIQGGDPRGDGWGGPGYAIRSEWSLINYERGSVGLASAGKDTEGCQFFVTHSPQPHLDGRYTIFARVVRGMEVVDAIQRGDRMVRVELLR